VKNSSTALPIVIRDLSKKYGSLYALNSIDLDVNSGEFLTLLGPSGSGKTTLLMAIAGFNQPDSGSIRFGDKEMITAPPHQREVGMVFQSYALFPHMTVEENIAFPLKLRKMNSKESQDRVEEALSTVQLSDFGTRRIDQLSGGQKQRVALARAFVFKPRILLMDEPLSALDKKLREQMQIELKQLHRKLGVTTVYVTHDQREALTMSDRIAVINNGSFEQIETPQAIYNSPANQFVADFIGESTMLPLKRDSSGQLFFNDLLINNDFPTSTNEELLLVVRPERLFNVEDSNADLDQTIIFTGKINEFVYQGETAFALVSISDKDILSIRFNTDSSGSQSFLKPGETIRIGLKRSEAIIISKSSI